MEAAAAAQGTRALDRLSGVLFANSLWRRVLLVWFDGGVAAASFWLAMVLRFEGVPTPEYATLLPTYLCLAVLARLAASPVFRLQHWSFRSSGLADGLRVVGAVLAGTGSFLLAIVLLQIKMPPRSVLVMDLFFAGAGMGGFRFLPRVSLEFLAERQRRGKNGKVRTLILGAGVAGEMLCRDLGRSREHNYQVVGFLDDDPGKRGLVIQNRPVFGNLDELPAVAQKLRIEQVLIAIPRISGKRVRDVLFMCRELRLGFKILPVSYAYLDERGLASRLQDLSPEDLLPRPEVEFSGTGFVRLVRERRVLVTGAAGSIGGEICRQLVKAGVRQLVMVDINENDLYMLFRRLLEGSPGSDIVCALADIRDRGRLEAIFKNHRPQDVFHAAAHKHVPVMEWAACEAIKNNVLGTWNAAHAAIAVDADRFVYISTDKAVRPTSVMGASKRVGELLVRALGRRSATKFTAVRFGNVLGSAGSVVPLFREQILNGGPVTVTHPEVRRYFMSLREAVSLVLRAAYADYGELLVLDMGEQIRILDLARMMISMAGLVPEKDIPIIFTGLRPGEKLYEELLTEEEEETVRIDGKIMAAKAPDPPLDLMDKVEQLVARAKEEDEAGVRALLKAIVPSYHEAQTRVALGCGAGAAVASRG